MNQRQSVAMSVLCSALAIGCGDDEAHVPFKLGAQNAAQSGKSASAASADPSAGQSFAAGTQRLTLQGHTLTLATHTFRAALEADLNADGRRDALLVLQNEQGVPALALALADAEGLGSVELKGALAEADARCELPEATLTRLSSELALLRMSLACTSPSAAAPEAPAPDAPAAPDAPTPPAPDPAAIPAPPEPVAAPGPHEYDVLVRIDPDLTIAERLALHDSTSPEPASIKVSWSARDLDADEHTDVMLTLAITTPGATDPIEIAMPMLDRPSGFARDATPIEAKWVALADEAKQVRKSQPDKSYAIAARVRIAHEALCRERGRALIELSGSHGIECGPSLGAGRAATIEAAGLARKGRVLDALRTFEAALNPTLYALTSNDRDRAAIAIAEQAALRFRRGPILGDGTAKAPVHAELAFVDETHLLVDRDGHAVTHDVLAMLEDAGADTPLAHASDLALSPTGHWIGVVADNRIYVGELNATPSPAPAPAPAPAPPPAPSPSPQPVHDAPPAPPEPTHAAPQ